MDHPTAKLLPHTLYRAVCSFDYFILLPSITLQHILKKRGDTAVQMSQSRSKASPATPAEPYTKLPSAAPKIEPTNVLPTGIAFSFSQVLPGLVTTLLLSRFKDVVADPVATLTSLLLPLSTLQVAYCVLCLPPHQNAPTPSSSTQNQPSAGGSVNSNPARKKTGNGHTKLSSLPSRIIVSALLHLELRAPCPT